MTPERLLACEATHPRHTPTKKEAIRQTLGIGEARYYELLKRAAASDEGMRADPITARHVRERTRYRPVQRYGAHASSCDSSNP